MAAFGEEHAVADPQIGPSTNPKFGDYQANVAMPLGKRLKRNPRDVAQSLVERLDLVGVCAQVDVAGPGFINLRLEDAFLLDQLAAASADDRLAVAPAEPRQTVVVDYCGPNVAKQMHVGHLRSLLIGDSFSRVLGFLGHEVIRQNHVGDWGLQMGMVTHAVEQASMDPSELTLEGMEQLYRRTTEAAKDDQELSGQLIERTRNLQNSLKSELPAWNAARTLTLDVVHATFKRLGVLLGPDDERGESAYAELYDPMVNQLVEDGFAQRTDGAIGIFPPGFINRDGQPLPFRIVSRDGTYQYATFDLAALRHRTQNLHAQRIIYTHDSRQADHFAMLFAVGRQVGYVPDQTRLDYAPFGTVLGADGKPLKTREGDNVKLSDLLDEAVSRARTLIDRKDIELPEAQRQAVAAAVGIGAVKYADLSNDRVKDYVFDWDRMLAFEGNTAPYLQNAFVRIRSIFRKGDVGPADVAPRAATIGDPAERILALRLVQFPTVVAGVAESLEPHRLCTYLYELATAFHQFYEKCPVLNAASNEVRGNRLHLCDVTARTLGTGLDLLGIEAVEQM